MILLIGWWHRSRSCIWLRRLQASGDARPTRRLSAKRQAAAPRPCGASAGVISGRGILPAGRCGIGVLRPCLHRGDIPGRGQARADDAWVGRGPQRGILRWGPQAHATMSQFSGTPVSHGRLCRGRRQSTIRESRSAIFRESWRWLREVFGQLLTVGAVLLMIPEWAFRT